MQYLLIETAAHSNIGLKRKNNEDNFYLDGKYVDSAQDKKTNLDSRETLFTAVLDGMGGEAAGEKASLICALACEKSEKAIISDNFSDDSINNLICSANKNVCNQMQTEMKRMGSTFVMLGFNKGQVTIANVGDSRAYLVRDGEISQLSQDHTEAQTMVDSGLISQEDSQHIKEKHKLTQHIGIFEEEMIIEPYIKRFIAEKGDIILLCSDGLTDMVPDEDIRNTLIQDKTAEKLSDELVRLALDNGGKDNVTISVSKVCEDKSALSKNHKKLFFALTCAAVLFASAVSCIFALMPNTLDIKNYIEFNQCDKNGQIIYTVEVDEKALSQEVSEKRFNTLKNKLAESENETVKQFAENSDCWLDFFEYNQPDISNQSSTPTFSFNLKDELSENGITLEQVEKVLKIKLKNNSLTFSAEDE